RVLKRQPPTVNVRPALASTTKPDGQRRLVYGNPPGQRPQIQFGMTGGPPPRDILILLAVLFGTFSLSHLGARGLIEWLMLTPRVWQSFAVWQVVTYPFVGYGAPSIWFLLELLILFWFGKDVYRRLGRANFWRLVAWTTIPAAAVAVVLQLFIDRDVWAAFPLLQGQRILLAVFIAAFATLFGQATIYLFFVLPVKARWFIWIEILFAFVAMLGTEPRDFAGFAGICVAVGMAYSMCTPGGFNRVWSRWVLMAKQKQYRSQLERERKKRGFRVIDGEGRGDGPRDPWVN
ncbi:MAG: hypothetical protein AAGD38_17855, partial [Acidobacteriota bacterium]